MTRPDFDDASHDRITEMTEAILTIVQQHYQRGPTHRDRVLEAVNALAIASAVAIKGTESEQVMRFFQEAFNKQMDARVQ
jgi:hypothetical protein